MEKKVHGRIWGETADLLLYQELLKSAMQSSRPPHDGSARTFPEVLAGRPHLLWTQRIIGEGHYGSSERTLVS